MRKIEPKRKAELETGHSPSKKESSNCYYCHFYEDETMIVTISFYSKQISYCFTDCLKDGVVQWFIITDYENNVLDTF